MTEGTPQELSPRARVMTYLNNPMPDRELPDVVAGAAWSGVKPKLAGAIVDALLAQKWPILLSGPVGLGKSYAMACVYMGWRQQAVWRNAGSLLNLLVKCDFAGSQGVPVMRSNGTTDYEHESSIYKKVSEYPLLCLDELGSSKQSDKHREKLNNILDHRKGKPLIVTTNLSSERFEEVYDARTHSRLWGGSEGEGVVILCDGPDRRMVGTTVIKAKD